MGFNEISFRFFVICFTLVIDIPLPKPFILNHQSIRFRFLYNKRFTFTMGAATRETLYRLVKWRFQWILKDLNLNAQFNNFPIHIMLDPQKSFYFTSFRWNLGIACAVKHFHSNADIWDTEINIILPFPSFPVISLETNFTIFDIALRVNVYGLLLSVDV